MMVGLFLVIACLTFVRLEAVFWSCPQDCSWKTINNDTKSCTFEEEASGERAVCSNIFESGESRRHRTNSEVNIQNITRFISLNKNAEKIIGLNISFQLPTDAEKNEYRGILIKLTSKQNTHCFYINFNEPLKIYDILIMKTFEAVSMSFHFDCIRGFLPGQTYKVAVIMMAQDSISKEVEKTVTIPCKSQLYFSSHTRQQ
ncbi:uncharacterized protein LOC117105100 [Anneissia japonica]|uniref:uncharacterized protein LOC117105100 n=1 Tax=Anneissia japonica TaxID=1529436 RepID=UPI0014257473|nr:uncharacterized protein LOC117105100 [Anneissia japonica]